MTAYNWILNRAHRKAQTECETELSYYKKERDRKRDKVRESNDNGNHFLGGYSRTE